MAITPKKVSVIIPTYNRREDLKKCLDSLLKQDYGNIEILVIDNNSTDGTREMILEKYPEVFLLCNKKNIYASRPRNRGAAESSGEYLWFLDSDAVVAHEDCLSNMVQILESDKTIGSVGGTVYPFSDGSEKLVLPQSGVFNIIDDWDNSAFEIADCDYLMTSNLLIGKKLFLELGGFVEEYEYLLEDNDLGLRIKRKGFKNITDRRTVVAHPFKPAPMDFRKAYIFYRNTFFYIFSNFRMWEWFSVISEKMRKGRFGYQALKTEEKKEKKKPASVYLGLLLGLPAAVILFIEYIAKRTSQKDASYVVQYLNDEGMNRHVLGRHKIAEGFIKRTPFFIKILLVNLYLYVKRLTAYDLSEPSKIMFFITNRCNLKCKHCFYKSNINRQVNELSREEINMTLASLKNRLDNICFTGGEPFLRDDLVSICRFIDERRSAKSITIPTNGYDPNRIVESVYGILRNTSLKLRIQVSLDGPEHVHDKIRGVSGSFKEAVTLIKKLSFLQSCNNALSVSIMTVISARNYRSIFDLDDFIHNEFKGIEHDFQFVRFASDAKNIVNREILEEDCMTDEDSRLPPLSVCDEITRLYKSKHGDDMRMRWKILSKLHHLEVVSRERNMLLLKCMAGKSSIVIYPDGCIAICEMTKPFANLRDFNYDLRKIWRSPGIKKYRDFTSNCFCTYSCAINDAMHCNKNAFLMLLGDA